MTYNGKEVPWQQENIIFPFLPKKHIKSFTDKGKVFMSKQVPLLINAVVKNQEDDSSQMGGSTSENEVIKIMFKHGDDLRQDNLVL